MSADDVAKTIQVLTREDDDLSRSGRVELITKPLKIETLRDRFKDFLSNLRSIVDVEEADTGAFELRQIEFKAEITADGELKLMGTGVGIEASHAVTFVLERKAEPKTTGSQPDPKR